MARGSEMTDRQNSLDATINLLRERAPNIDWDLFLRVLAETKDNRGDESGRSPPGQKSA
jgi:hypothetical protein